MSKGSHSLCMDVMGVIETRQDMEFRIYNKMNCTLFDMIGHKEPDQTKGLGYILANSKEAMNIFLGLIQKTYKRFQNGA